MLKQLLKSKSVKQKVIANSLQVTESLVSQWCSGKCEPKISQLKPLSQLLNVDLDTLVSCFGNESEVEA